MAKVFDMGNTSTVSNWTEKPFSLAEMAKAFEKLMTIDCPKEIRCSPAYMAQVKRMFPPAIVDPMMPPDAFRFEGLPISIDDKMTGMRAEVHWRSGKVEDISPKNYGLLDRCKGRDESKEQNT